jgi:hypothetical protein
MRTEPLTASPAGQSAEAAKVEAAIDANLKELGLGGRRVYQ